MALNVGEGASKMATLSKMQCGPIDKPFMFMKDFVVVKKGVGRENKIQL